MIPATLFGCRFWLTDGTKVEVRALDFAPTYFTFRLRHGIGEKLGRGAAELLFFCKEESIYRKIQTENYRIDREGDAEAWTVWRFETKDRGYAEEAIRLTRDYIDYIELKQTCEDAEIANTLTDYSVDEEQIGNSISEQRKIWFQKLPARNLCIPDAMEVGIALTDESIWDQYLELPLQEFCRWYFATYIPGNMDFTSIRIGCMQVGSEWCHLLFPDTEKLERILNRMVQQNVQPILAFSSMAEHQIQDVKDRIHFLEKWAQKTGILPELVINDMGMCYLLEEACEMEFPRTLGVLPVRRRKDVRLKWLPAGARGTQRTLLDDPEYLEYLKTSCRISRFSYESTGDLTASTNHTGSGGTMYLPWYQMNTSTWCTLQAAVREGARGRQKEITCCGRECSQHAFLYPDELGMTGRYNSLFGLDREVLADDQSLDLAGERGIDRILFRCM